MAGAGKVKATGQRGEWFATVRGTRYPCIHEYWIKAGHHAAPNVNPTSNSKDAQLVQAIMEQKLVIETRDEVLNEGAGFVRLGYKKLWRVDNVRLVDDVLHFDLMERVLDLK